MGRADKGFTNFTFVCAVTTLGLLASATNANAAGFAVREQSVEGQGASFAGIAAGGNDLSSIFFNPATITLHPGLNIEVNGSLIIPDSRLSGGAAVHPALGPLAGGNGGNIGVLALVPATYTSYQVNQRLFVGLGINSPFGLSTKANDNWLGRFHAIESTVLSINANPVIGYKVSPMISIAAGVQVEYIDVKLTNSVFSAAGESFAELEADDFGYGFTLGVLFEPTPATRIGIGFRSKVEHTVKGNAEFTPGLQVPTPGGVIGPFARLGVRGTLTLPETVSIGLRQKISPKITLLAGFEWANWSRFNELRIEFDTVLPDTVTDQQWSDSYFYSLGGEYNYDEKTIFRAGVAFENSSVPDATRTPRIPDNDRYWASVGLTHQVTESISVSAAYTHIFVKKASINLTTLPDNATRGSLSGTYKTNIDILSISLKKAF